MDRAKRGCKRHIVVDAQGTVLIVNTSPGNLRDDLAVPAMLPTLTEQILHPLRALHGDRGYGFDNTILQVQSAGIEPVLAERDMPKDAHGSGLGRIRRVVEQTLSHFGHFRRLKICYEKTGSHFQAFHDLAAALLCHRRLTYYIQCVGEL